MRQRAATRALPACLICLVLMSPAVSLSATDLFFTRAQRNGFQESAFARGYADGYQQGLSDGRSGERYDAVRHREYRDGDQGYNSGYGSREAYRNNYRAGFRQGYEDGYREGTGRRR